MAFVPNTPEAAITLVMALLGNLVDKGVLSRTDFDLIVAAANTTSSSQTDDQPLT